MNPPVGTYNKEQIYNTQQYLANKNSPPPGGKKKQPMRVTLFSL